MEPRAKGRKRPSRTEGRFDLVPHSVKLAPGYRALTGRPAICLLHDLMMQYTGTNNGRIVACERALRPLGWRSKGVIQRAVSDLVDHGLLIRTRQGSRPSKASLYALPWRSLDRHPHDEYDPGTLEAFTKLRRIYLEFVPPQRPRKVCAPRAEKNASRPPLNGVEAEFTGPLNGVEGPLATPLDGPVMHLNGRPPTPFSGDCIDTPSARSAAQGDSKGGKPRGGPRAPRAIGPRGA